MPSHRHDFGKYKLLRRIAAGGMGEVHLAKLVGPSGFEKLVVIKRLLQSRQSEQKYVDMFFAEARVAAQLGHSNIVQVYEVGTIDEVPYIAMEYVHGKSLRKVLDRAIKRPTSITPHGMPPGFTAHIISQLCLGLAFAHDARHLSGATIGLVHRDINPHNVLISYQGEVKIIDFGIAKSELSLDQTQAGTIKGTVVYMSPEQSLGEKLDKRSDLFSVGICLYEALTGKNPFHKSGMGASLEAIRQAQYPAVDQERAELGIFAPILTHALAKNRSDRYADCAQLAEALRELIERGQVPRPPMPLASYMAELFGQEMLEEEQLLERTDMVRNPLLVSQPNLGTRPMERATVRDDSQPGAENLPPPSARTPAHPGDTSGKVEHTSATQADVPLEAAEPTRATGPMPPVPSPAAPTRPPPQEASRSNTPNPLMALVRPLRPGGQRLMTWARSRGDGATLRQFWPYIASFAMVFSVMGTLFVVTGPRFRTQTSDVPPPAPSGALQPPPGAALVPAGPGVLADGAERVGPMAQPLRGDATAQVARSGDAEDDGLPERRRRARRAGHGRADAGQEGDAEGLNPSVQIKADPPVVVQYDNAAVGEAGAQLKTITGTIKVGQNPDSDSFLVALNYRLTPRGISYQIESTPWADVTGPGGVQLGRTPLRWTEPSQLLSLEFTNPHVPRSQRITIRVVH